MKLEKAIELSKEAKESLKQHKFHDHADAVQLGIEAMLRIYRQRRLEIPVNQPLLQGETNV